MDKLIHVPILLASLVVVALVVGVSTDEVVQPPSIIKEPANKYKLFRGESETFSFTCKAKGVPTPTYQWYKNGNLVKSDEFINVGADGTLKFLQAMAYHEGYYQCHARNDHGKAMSKVIFLQRAVAASFPVISTVPYVKDEGDFLVVTCEGARSVPVSRTTFSWAYAPNKEEAGYAVNLNERVSQDDKGNLYFANVLANDHQDGKIYRCNLRNTFLDVTYGGSYSTIKVNANPSPGNKPPKVMHNSGSSGQIALIGQKVEMKCLFSGLPSPKINWKKVDGNLPRGRYIIKSHEQVLEISDVRVEDEAKYQCEGTNEAGASTPEIIQLKVESEPSWKTNGEPKNINATVGDTVSFVCRVDAIPQANVQWFINGEPLSSSNLGKDRQLSDEDRNLTITNVRKPEDLGNVQCNTSNIHGYKFADAYLNVLLATKITLAPTDKKIDENTTEVMFNVDATSDVATPVTIDWLHNGNNIAYNPGVVEKLNNNSLYINCRDMSKKKKVPTATLR